MDSRDCLRAPNGELSLRRQLARRFHASPTTSLTSLALAGVLAAACGTSASNSLSPSGTPGSSSGGSSGGTTSSSSSGSSSGGGSGSSSGGAEDAGSSNPPGLDPTVFASTIQPILDTAGGGGCTNTSCHGSAAGIGGFALTRQPAAGSAQMQANFQSVSALCDLAVPDQSNFYLQATNSHAGVAVSQTQGSTILSWIQHATSISVGGSSGADGGTDDGGSGTTSKPGCTPASAFNLGVFSAEIQPILFGTLDYNEAPGQAVANNGCARSTCHGSSSNPLFISTTNTPVQNLASLGCFVDLANPSSSSLLLCPLNDPGCPKTPHPGQDVFASEQDLNFQRIASWIYAAQGAASPLDLAFFARQVAPIFSDPASGGIAGGQRTCADTGSCHGVSAVGQAPPNLSNFPILASASNLQGFTANYWAAANFTNFLTPTGSELFLYPTNLIANTTNQPYATGLAHPGGVDFSPTSAQAQAILTWSSGLQLDQNGDLLNWLVAGTYDATLVTQNTQAGNDATLAPTIFDSDGAPEFNGGIWDLDSSANEFIDLNAEFPGNAGSGRVAYAVANVINATGADLQNVQVTVTSPNAALLYVGQASSEGSLNGNNTVSLSATLPAFATGKTLTRILVKVLQRPGDAQFGFTLNMTQQNNQPFQPGELIFRLDPTGGI